MYIKLYYNSSENNQLRKNITLTKDLDGTLRHESNKVYPEILIEATSLGDSNYAYIPEFSRYYYIKEIVSIRNGLWLVKMESDPLMSFQTNIKQLEVILQESESIAIDKYLADDRVWVAKVKDKTDILSFPNSLLTDGEYILITAGG